METADALSLVIFYFGAFFMPLMAGKLHIPAAVGEILFGVAVGTNGLGLVHPSDFTGFLADLGFIFLMFLVGAEIDFNRIEKEGVKGVTVASLVAVSTLAVGAAVAWQLDYPFYMALVLGAMSVGILVVALVEAGESQSRFGQVLLLVASIGEFLTLIALTAYNLIYRHGVGRELLEEVGKALFLFVVAYSLLAVLKLLVWWFPHQFRRWVDVDDSSEIGVRAGFVLMLSLAALSGWVGLEAILGAFLAGALFSYVFRDKGMLETKLSAVGQGFFVPMFFIHLGVSFDPGALGDLGAMLRLEGELMVASLVTSALPAVLLIVLGFSLRQVIASAFLLATPLTLLVAAASMGHELGVLNEQMTTAVVLLAIVSGVIFPIFFKIVTPHKENATAIPSSLDDPRANDDHSVEPG